MRDLPAELIYVVLFLGVLFFQYLMKRRLRREPQEPPEDDQVDYMPADAESALPTGYVTPAAWPAPGARAEQARPAQTTDTSHAGAHGRFSRHALMSTRRDVQNAVVIATILGPCRALEPPAAEAGKRTVVQ